MIPARDISESYLSKRNVNLPPRAPNSSKGTRRKFAPSFLLRRKKIQATNKNYGNIDEYDEDDLTDIASYDDLVAVQNGINPVILRQLDDSKINTIELEQYDKFYRNRLHFVINNYRQPPTYPGHNSGKDKRTSTKAKPNNVDTPLMRQLLNDKGLNDNAIGFEPGEMEALIPHYRKKSYEPYSEATGESVSLYSQDPPSNVPPSPNPSAEIPEWLKVYAKASPDLDQYLKWEMFRYVELDCWQAMLKRLYKEELEQIVLWFEEYRLQLQDEFEARITV